MINLFYHFTKWFFSNYVVYNTCTGQIMHRYHTLIMEKSQTILMSVYLYKREHMKLVWDQSLSIFPENRHLPQQIYISVAIVFLVILTNTEFTKTLWILWGGESHSVSSNWNNFSGRRLKGNKEWLLLIDRLLLIINFRIFETLVLQRLRYQWRRLFPSPNTD